MPRLSAVGISGLQAGGGCQHYIGWKKYYRNVDGKFVFVTAESFVDSLKEAEGTV